MKTILRSMTILVAITVAGTALGQQTLEVTKKVGGINASVAVAVNPATGDILVAWHRAELPNLSNSSIWAALMKRKASGKYTVRKPRQLSDDGVNAILPDVRWLSGNREFLVAWQTVVGADGTNSVQARALKRKSGKPSTKVIAVASASGTTYSNPLVRAFGAAIEVVYAKTTGTARSAAVDADYVVRELSNKYAVQPGDIVVTEIRFTQFPRFEYLARAECYVVVARVFTGSRVKTFLHVFNSAGQVVDSFELKGSERLLDVQTTGDLLSRGLLMLRNNAAGGLEARQVPFNCTVALDELGAWVEVGEGPVRSFVFAAAFLPLTPAGMRGASVDRIVVAADDGFFSEIPVDDNLQPTGEITPITEITGLFLAMDAVELPAVGRMSAATPDTAIFWVAGEGSAQRIFAHLYRSQ